MDISSEMIHSLLPVFMVTALGTTVLVVGLIEGAAEATALIVKVFSGVLSDYWGGASPGRAGLRAGRAHQAAVRAGDHRCMVLAARLIDRVGKGIRGAPRDALIADIAPRTCAAPAFGLRQSLDTVGAFLGPLVAIGLMLLWANDFRAVFWVAVIPGVLSVAAGLCRARARPAAGERRGNPIRRENLRRLAGLLVGGRRGTMFTLARFSEAFLVLRAQQEASRWRGHHWC